MTSTLSNYRIRYLSSGMNDSTASPEPGLTGYYRHELVLAATGEQEAVQAVVERGGVVLSVKTVAEKGPLARLLIREVSRSYKQKFLQALAFNVQAGLSAEKALEQVILGELGPPRLALNRSLNALSQGFGFVSCLELLEWFDEGTLAVLRAGEAVGQLSKALDTAVGFYTRGSQSIKLMFGAVSWTLLDLVMAASTVVGMRYGLIEELKKNPLKSENQDQVDRFNQAVELAQSVNDGLLILSFVMALLVVYIVLMLASRDAKVREQCYRMLEKVPIVKVLIQSASLSNTMRVLSSLLKGGVVFLEALHISKRGAFSPSIQAFLENVQARTEIGEHPSSAFNHIALDSSERLLIRAHRDQMQLADSLESIASARDDMAAAAAKRFAVVAFIASLIYSGVAVVFALAVVYLQNQVVISGG